MSDWPLSVRLPGFDSAHERRRRTITERLPTDPATDRDRVLIAFALMAARCTDRTVVTIPVLVGARWHDVTLDFGRNATIAALSEQARDGLERPAGRSSPPPSTAVAVVGETAVDPSLVVLGLAPKSELTLTGPVEPFGGIGLLARRLEWLIDAVGQGRELADIDSIAPHERATTALQRLGASTGPARHVVTLIEQTARRIPHAPAVSTPWTTLTYDELMNLVADRHAMLRRRGIHEGQVVGLHLARSTDLVATMLALWRARAAFVPFTDDHPRQRVLQMLDDAGAEQIVTDLGRWTAAARSIDTIALDRTTHERRTRPRREAVRSFDDLAYVLFTSGTTGRPKGISVTQANLAHFFAAVTVAIPGTTRRGAVLAATPISFDPAMLELIWPLTHGWEVVVDPGNDVPLGPVARRRRVTHFNSTPTMAALMLHDRDGREVLDTVDHLLLGGEGVRAELVAELGKVSRADVTVCYGPTEATVDVTWGLADPTIRRGLLPIGRPLPGHAVDIVDRHDRTVGALSVGELVVTGPAVAAGYVGAAPKPSPFFSRHGERAFRSGDLVWSDVDGVIHFVGRRDHQVKIRGHRIEVGEVDARLVEHPLVVAAATVVIGEGEHRRLVTFTVESDPVEPRELRRWLEDALPRPMVPTEIHRLERLPRTSSNKTDLDALRDLARSRAAAVGQRRALTNTEARVAALFEEVLDIAMVPPDRSIFDLGGNSVSAVRLVSELESLVDHRVRLTTLLDLGTVEQIAAAIDQDRLGDDPGTLITIDDRSPGLPVYCVAGPDGHAVNLRPLGEAIGRPFHGLEFAGTDGITAPDPTIEAMASRFASVVSDHRGAAPIVLAGYAGGGLVALEMASRLTSVGTPVALLVLIDTTNPELESRSLGRKVVDGLRELRAPDDLAPIGVLRNRVVADRLARRENLLTANRQGQLPDIVDLSPEFERAVEAWVPPGHGGPVLLVRAATGAPAMGGWDHLMTGPFEAVTVDHDPVTMMLRPEVDQLAAVIDQAVERIEGASAG